MPSPSLNSLDKYGNDDVFSTLLRWGLYFAAFFQLACILAAMFLPPTTDKNEQRSIYEDSKVHSNDSQPISRRLHKLRKQEKKKRR